MPGTKNIGLHALEYTLPNNGILTSLATYLLTLNGARTRAIYVMSLKPKTSVRNKLHTPLGMLISPRLYYIRVIRLDFSFN